MFNRLLAPAVLWTAVCVLAASPGWAHRVNLFAWVEGDILHAQGKFVGGTPVKEGQIQVLDPKSGQVLLTGKTDSQGNFSGKIPPTVLAQKLDLQVVLEAGMGHRGDWLIKAENYLKTPEPSPGVAASEKPGAGEPAESPLPLAKERQTLDRRVLEEVVSQVLDRKLAPIMGILAESQGRKPSLPDIIGGIGYILGIWGLVAYYKSKRLSGR